MFKIPAALTFLVMIWGYLHPLQPLSKTEYATFIITAAAWHSYGGMCAS